MVNIEWKVAAFEELSLEQFYVIAQLRADVFCIEQNCLYQDLDGRDQQASHISGYINGELVAYARTFTTGIAYNDAASIGRVLIKESYRKKRLGKALMEKAINVLKQETDTRLINISAQAHLEGFYNVLGFVSCSDIYDEDGIPHIRMGLKN